jgi:hypothetical protein
MRLLTAAYFLQRAAPVTLFTAVHLLLLLSSLLSSSTFLTPQQFSLFSQQHGLTDQALHIHCSTKNFLTVRHVLSVTALCVRIYRAGRRLSGVKLSCDLFGIIPAADSTSGII